MDFIAQIKKIFKTSDAWMKLIIINVGVFLLYHVVHLFYFLFAAQDQFKLYDWLAAPTDFDTLLTRPWTLITYMFFHKEILHLLFNMLWLYWFGMIFRYYFNNRQLVNVYIFGGLAGVLLYILSYNVFPVFAEAKYLSSICGASAGVLAVVLAISCYVPKYTINLLIFGRIKLIYIALASVAIDVISISMSDNAGGHIAHLGGAFFGYIFAVNMQKGKDITAWFSRLSVRIENLLKPRPKMRVAYKRTPNDDREYNRQKTENQHEIDRILDKISKGGYDTLTKKEKETLFNQKK